MKKVHIKHFISKNFGDALSPIMIKMINPKLEIVSSGKKIRLILKIKKLFRRAPKNNFLIIGSIISYADKNSIIWGSGFISKDAYCKEKPKKVLAVRGPLTRKKLIDQKIDCPKVFGDPALLLPKFFKPKVRKKYKLGVIPHYVDRDADFLKKIKGNEEILIIDINSGIKKVTREILSCRKIASSSLHGIIISDAYNIPSVWIEFSKKVKGEGFKFRDYFLSVKRNDHKPLKINDKTTLDEIGSKFKQYNKSKINTKALWSVCPFR